MKYDTGGDPIKGIKWMRTTPGKVASYLRHSLGINISRTTVRKFLRGMGYSLKCNRKVLVPKSAPERDQQFYIIRDKREEFEAEGEPIISVDTKKRELVGLFKNPGRIWTKKAVNVYEHDFRSQAEGVAIPYGVYDVQANHGFVFVGTTHDTPEFAVSSIAKWWRYQGRRQYPNARELLILADAGGSNGPRGAWKRALQEKLSDRYGLTIVVSHYPSGTSKWNPIEHRLFSEITKNWTGCPLDSYETVLNYIGTTTTNGGLKVKSYLDWKRYETGTQIPSEILKHLSIEPDENLAKWNYTIQPREM